MRKRNRRPGAIFKIFAHTPLYKAKTPSVFTTFTHAIFNVKLPPPPLPPPPFIPLAVIVCILVLHKSNGCVNTVANVAAVNADAACGDTLYIVCAESSSSSLLLVLLLLLLVLLLLNISTPFVHDK